MKSVVSSTLLIIVYALSLHGFIFSQEIVKTREVVVDGIGVSPEAAKKNAFRNAVSKVVGSFIENDILIKNDKIIEDKLLEYSGGFVETFEVISESKDKDGLFKVKLKAKIAQQTVVQKLRSMKIDVKSVSGSNLKAQLETQETMKNEGGKFISSIMEEYPKLWQAKQIGEPKIANGKLALQIEVSVDRTKYLEWVDKLCKVLEKSSNLKIIRSYAKSGPANYNKPILIKIENLNVVVNEPYYFKVSPAYLKSGGRLSGKIFAIVEDFSVSGDCKIAHFIFEESNPLYSFFSNSKATQDKGICFRYANNFVPNQLNIVAYDASEKVISKYSYKSKYGGQDWGYTLWNPNSHLGMNPMRGTNYTNPITPFPFIYQQRAFESGENTAVYATKCIIDANVPIDGIDVSKISKIVTGFSIEK